MQQQEIIDKINRVMSVTGVSKSRLAQMAGMDLGGLSNLLSGKRENLNFRTIARVCEPLGITLIAKAKNETETE